MTLTIKVDNCDVIIDAEDLEFFKQYQWKISDNNYLYHKAWVGRNIRFHRELLGVFDPTVDVDHINRDTLDNRKINLRICSHQQNCFNSKAKRMATKTSKYKGVCWNKQKQRWCSSLGVNYHTINIYSSSVEEECAYAYNIALKAVAGDFACLNPVDESLIPEHLRELIKLRVSRKVAGLSLKHT